MSIASSADSGIGAVPPSPAARPSWIVIGLGNPILGDDAVGWHVAERVRQQLGPQEAADVRVEALAVGGLSLMERLIGFRGAVIIDAVLTGRDPVGTVGRIGLSAIPGAAALHLDSPHDTGLVDALAAGRALGADLPDEIAIVSIEAARVADFTEAMTPAVSASVPVAAALVLELLRAADGPSLPDGPPPR